MTHQAPGAEHAFEIGQIIEIAKIEASEDEPGEMRQTGEWEACRVLARRTDGTWDVKLFCDAGNASDDGSIRAVAPEHLRELEHGEVYFIKHDGFISKGGDLHREFMTTSEAKHKALDLEGCRGFCFRGESNGGIVDVIFKDKFDSTVGENKWTSYELATSDAAVESAESTPRAAADQPKTPEKLQALQRHRGDEITPIKTARQGENPEGPKAASLKSTRDPAISGTAVSGALAAASEVETEESESDGSPDAGERPSSAEYYTIGAVGTKKAKGEKGKKRERATALDSGALIEPVAEAVVEAAAELGVSDAVKAAEGATADLKSSDGVPGSEAEVPLPDGPADQAMGGQEDQSKEKVEQYDYAGMRTGEVKAALKEMGVKIPRGLMRKDLIKMLDDAWKEQEWAEDWEEENGNGDDGAAESYREPEPPVTRLELTLKGEVAHRIITEAAGPVQADEDVGEDEKGNGWPSQSSAEAWSGQWNWRGDGDDETGKAEVDPGEKWQERDNWQESEYKHDDAGQVAAIQRVEESAWDRPVVYFDPHSSEEDEDESYENEDEDDEARTPGVMSVTRAESESESGEGEESESDEGEESEEEESSSEGPYESD